MKIDGPPSFHCCCPCLSTSRTPSPKPPNLPIPVTGSFLVRCFDLTAKSFLRCCPLTRRASTMTTTTERLRKDRAIWYVTWQPPAGRGGMQVLGTWSSTIFRMTWPTDSFFAWRKSFRGHGPRRQRIRCLHGCVGRSAQRDAPVELWKRNIEESVQDDLDQSDEHQAAEENELEARRREGSTCLSPKLIAGPRRRSAETRTRRTR